MIIIPVIVIIIAYVVYNKVEQASHIYTVKRDKFEAVVASKGEIQSEKSVPINFPELLSDRSLNVYQSQIKDLVQEGTIVKKGDYVALLDQGLIKQLTQTTEEALQKAQASFYDAKIDSAVSLSAYRDELEQLTFDLRYKKIDVEQAVYDSPANQRKAQIAYDRTARLLESKRRSYIMRQNELKIRCARNERYLNMYKEMSEKYKQALIATTINAPEDGMVIYARKFRGRKTKIGDYVSSWDRAIATLPDLSTMASETYVEEIYISKIHVGDSVRVYVDALKNKVFPGCISNISNIGQEMAGFDANVFKIYIKLDGDLSKLKPSMTTNNEIIIKREDNALVIPLASLFAENKVPYVYLKEAGVITKRKVETGEKNDKFIIIKSGLIENDKILMNKPPEDKVANDLAVNVER